MRKSHTSPPSIHHNRSRSHAAFSTAMSEPQPEDWDQFIDWSKHVYEGYDWSKGDLLDACFDPMLQGMDLDGGRGGGPSNAQQLGVVKVPTASSSMGTAQLPDPGSVNVPAATLSIGPTEPPTPEMDREILVKSEAACAACGEVFTHRLHAVVEYRISVHAKNTGHLIWACSIIGCQKTFSTHRERDAHQDRPHVVGHGHFDTPTTYDCVECGHSSSSKADLLRHAKELQHRPYACECGSSFSRLDVLNRHLEKFDPEDPKHPCKYCRRHRGPNGFRRLDHLMQHIRNYHHHEMDNEPRKGTDTSRLVNNFPTCPHSDCPGFRDDTFKQQSRKIQHAGKPFATQSAFTKHTRDTHNECIFPCDVAGCERVGRLGYFREKDLLKHRRAQHPDASPYVVEKRATRWTCTRPGCSAILAFSSMAGHLRYHDWFASLSEASAAQVAGSPSWKRIGNDGSIDRS